MSLTEKRTQVSFTAGQHAALKRLAWRRGVSLAQVVREAVDAYVASPERAGGAVDAGDPLADLTGFVSGPVDLAERHDDYLAAGEPSAEGSLAAGPQADDEDGAPGRPRRRSGSGGRKPSGRGSGAKRR